MTRRPAGPRSRGGSTGAAPAARSWRERIDDPDEPLFTMAIAADLLGLDPQALRRLGEVVEHQESRPSGNQRRYSRNDLELLGRAAALAAEGTNASGIARILELERQVAVLQGAGSPRARSATPSPARRRRATSG